MIIVKATRPGLDDQFIPLQPGRLSVGSDLGCDIVFLENTVGSRHAILAVSGSGVEIGPAEDGATIEIQRAASGRRIVLKTDEHRSWFAGDLIRIGDVRLEIEGVEAEQAPTGASQAGGGRRRKIQLCVLLSSLAAGLAFVGPLPADGDDAPVRASMPSLPATPAGGQPTSRRLPDAATAGERLQALGIDFERLENTGKRWTAVLRAADAAGSRALLNRLAGLDFAFEPQIYVDTQMANAVELILSNRSAGQWGVSVERGVITLTGSTADTDATTALRQTIRADVPGVADLRFEDKANPESLSLRQRIVAVWSGDYPYVVLSDGAVVRPGETIAARTRLIGVSEEFLVIETAGREVRMRVE